MCSSLMLLFMSLKWHRAGCTIYVSTNKIKVNCMHEICHNNPQRNTLVEWVPMCYIIKYWTNSECSICWSKMWILRHHDLYGAWYSHNFLIPWHSRPPKTDNSQLWDSLGIVSSTKQLSPPRCTPRLLLNIVVIPAQTKLASTAHKFV